MGAYGYRWIKALLTMPGDVGCDRVQRIWRRGGAQNTQENKGHEAGCGSTMVLHPAKTGTTQSCLVL